MRGYPSSDPELLERAAHTIETQAKEISDLKLEVYLIKEKVNFFLFGAPPAPENIHVGGFGQPTFTETLKERAREIREEKKDE